MMRRSDDRALYRLPCKVRLGPEKVEKFPQLCGNCMQKAELEAMKQGPRPPIARSENMLAALEQTFKKSFGQA